MKRFLLPLVGVVAGLVLGIIAFVLVPQLTQPPELHGTTFADPRPGPDFTLTNGDGQAVSLSDFAGKVVLIYFGYTFCPDVCPATMSDLAKVQEAVDDDASDVQVIMVSVDPARDTPQRVGGYVAGFHPTFVGLSGSAAEIAAVAEEYGVFYEAEEGTEATGYLVSHTASVFVIDKAGRYRMTYPFGTPQEDIIADLNILIEE